MVYETIQGEEVPALGLGTWQVTGEKCREAVEHGLELGYRHVDTAQAYENEEQVGRGIQNSGVDRDELFLTTKVWFENLEAEAVRQSTEDSLRRLETDYVDLLLVHWPDPNDEVPLAETLNALRALQEDGKARHIGVSNFTPSLLKQALDHAKLFCIQVEYHPFLRQEEMLDMADEYDLLLTAYSPLARGKVNDDATLQAIGKQHGKSPAQVTLRWHMQQERTAAIPKASSSEHRESNFDLFDFELTDEEMNRIFGLARGERLLNPDFAPDWEQG